MRRRGTEGAGKGDHLGLSSTLHVKYFLLPGRGPSSGTGPATGNIDRAKCRPPEPRDMVEHHDVEEPDVQPEYPKAARTTAPQSAYTSGHVAVGVAVLAVGLLLTYGLALALT